MSTTNALLEYTLEDLKAEIAKYLYLEDTRIIDVILGTIVANKIKGDPLWLLCIAPPSNGKTEILIALDGEPEVYLLSSLTPHTLISGFEKVDEHRETSLLPNLNGKTLILKDFTSILSMRSESRQEILGQFREIYDGKYSKTFGTGKEVKWEGKVGLIGACTPVYDKHYAVIGALGERFILYRSNNVDRRKMGLQAQRIAGMEKEMRAEIRSAVHKFLSQFAQIHEVPLAESDEKFNEKLVDLALFCSQARCPVERNYRSQQIEYLPEPEGPARLTKQFMQLKRGLVLVQGKTGFDGEVYGILAKIGRDLAPTIRISVLEYLWKTRVLNHGGTCSVKTAQMMNDLSLPHKTLSLVLEDLRLIGLVSHKERGEASKAPIEWFLTDDTFDLIERAEIFKLVEQD